MDKILYDLMDWAAIEELVYSEAPEPKNMLGAHVTEAGILVQAFIPGASAVTVKLAATGKEYPMELQDEAGFFAVLVPGQKVMGYTLLVADSDGETEEIQDPYMFPSQYTESDLKKFAAGIHYEVYKKMGAHPMEIDGVPGVAFSVWAPCAMRVSVVGDFNKWDGRRHQMQRLGDSGIFELFIPGIGAGTIYKYEVKTRRGEPMLKSDPYGNYSELRPDNASIVWDIEKFQWSDEAWMKEREAADMKEKPISIYEIHLGSWIRKPLALDEDGKAITGSEYYNYREIAPRLAEYVKEMGYTHVELMPVMEHPFDGSWGYQVTGYYAPTSRYGTPDDFMYFMNYMHEQGIGVILDWVPAHFPRDAHGLAAFDGTCVYEHQDPRQGSHPHWGTLIYNYGRPQVSNFLIANALFWAEQYHADGIRMDAVASMLYLDYGKNDGEWVANIYGGHENLEAVEFLKHLNSIFKTRTKGAILIAEESTAWPQITGDVKNNGLGFDFKWNMGWMNDFTSYMKCDPLFRSYHYGELTFSMLYAYSENFVLVFSHDEVVHGKCSMLCKMPGADYEAKADNLRAAYGFMYGHPGKKLLFMGQEFAQVSEWNENEELPWSILDYPVHKGVQDYVKALNHLYLTQPALYQKDFQPEGFEWMNCSLSQENMAFFVRRTDKPEETLLFVCNFAPVEHKGYRIGVPFHGKYKEILNSDAKAYGGSGMGNPRAKNSKPEECDDRENSLIIDIPPMSTIVFSCTPLPVPGKKTEKKEDGAAEKKPAVKKSSAKTAGKAAEKAPAKAAEKTPAKAAEKAPAKAAEKTPAKAAGKAAAKTAEKASVKSAAKSAAETAEKAADAAEKLVTEKLEKKSTAKKTTARKTVEKLVKKVAEKKEPVKKETAKKETVKKETVKKEPVKKETAATETVKKPAARRKAKTADDAEK